MLETCIIFLGVTLLFGVLLLPSRKFQPVVIDLKLAEVEFSDFLGIAKYSNVGLGKSSKAKSLNNIACDLMLVDYEPKVEDCDELYYSPWSGNFYIYNTMERSLVIDSFGVEYEKTEIDDMVDRKEFIKLGDL